ncbi:hypothetical protein B0J12DRAFT_288055 [Macrophomina phaseolina]|uniref:Uncharacterized protein n=1 Tax=Macrophomina phaseolina TaxID=35725 RepID=A0ABQ8GNB8_9PEZI|nr:hypothetical protein B0J12DRAFT_288055 [Macrophomina phaseolina]
MMQWRLVRSALGRLADHRCPRLSIATVHACPPPSTLLCGWASSLAGVDGCEAEVCCDRPSRRRNAGRDMRTCTPALPPPPPPRAAQLHGRALAAGAGLACDKEAAVMLVRFATAVPACKNAQNLLFPRSCSASLDSTPFAQTATEHSSALAAALFHFHLLSVLFIARLHCTYTSATFIELASAHFSANYTPPAALNTPPLYSKL